MNFKTQFKIMEMHYKFLVRKALRSFPNNKGYYHCPRLPTKAAWQHLTAEDTTHYLKNANLSLMTKPPTYWLSFAVSKRAL